MVYSAATDDGLDYFLSNFVFLRHAKTFERKLVSSGWDIAMPLPKSVDTRKALKENVKPGRNAAGQKIINCRIQWYKRQQTSAAVECATGRPTWAVSY